MPAMGTAGAAQPVEPESKEAKFQVSEAFPRSLLPRPRPSRATRSLEVPLLSKTLILISLFIIFYYFISLNLFFFFFLFPGLFSVVCNKRIRTSYKVRAPNLSHAFSETLTVTGRPFPSEIDWIYDYFGFRFGKSCFIKCITSMKTRKFTRFRKEL